MPGCRVEEIALCGVAAQLNERSGPAALTDGPPAASLAAATRGCGQKRWSGTPSEGESGPLVARRTAQGGPVPLCGRGVCGSPGDRRESPVRRADQTPQVLRLGGPVAPQGHRHHDRHRHGDAQVHLRQPGDARALESEPGANRLLTRSAAPRWS